MNDTGPSDYSPLSYGAGLALGLCMLLGLPSAPERSRERTGGPDDDASPLPTEQVMRAHRELTSSGRP